MCVTYKESMAAVQTHMVCLVWRIARERRSIGALQCMLWQHADVDYLRSGARSPLAVTAGVCAQDTQFKLATNGLAVGCLSGDMGKQACGRVCLRFLLCHLPPWVCFEICACNVGMRQGLEVLPCDHATFCMSGMYTCSMQVARGVTPP